MAQKGIWKVKDFHWDQQITLPNGEVTPGRWLPMFDEYGLNTIEFKNKNVLDVGCLNGLYSFYAESKGAKVTSIDITEKVKTKHYQGNSCDSFLFAHSQFKSKVKYIFPYSVYDIPDLGTFDIVLCLGVIYHLAHPTLAIEKISGVLKKNSILVLETEIGSGPSLFYRADLSHKKIKKLSIVSPLSERIRVAVGHFLDITYKDKINLINYSFFSKIKTIVWSTVGLLYQGDKFYKKDPSNFWIYSIDDLRRIVNFFGFEIVTEIQNQFSSNRITLICKKIREVDPIYAQKGRYTNYRRRVSNLYKFNEYL